ncbi:TnsA endonuclease N-terminal domain-containing protein [Agarivorans aestuarii]|uniref:TnsA endonuclease N-terminal domain-containing protein n=1 Tax=Agarivorans aestuarii TaxID=1563703 RepID=A0ABU7G2T3_9ALTE|nr:TnsA endonuclease N-terminal domain-containing protein [Agarivorans aestuarii]MEE1673713.1 TnsA endonuclease N-terminal domain-containing protein [Agarivorans aestuarii]
MKTKTVIQPIITKREREKIERYLRRVKKEGYRPWETVRSSHTIGQGQIIINPSLDRVHHFLSRGESNPFFHFEANSKVIEIYEQYPLPIEQTLKIAEELNIVHPQSYEEASDFDGHRPAKTMSLDYVLKLEDKSLHAYNFKYADSLDPKITSPQSVARTEAKAQIERTFCCRNKMSWTQLTEESFDPNVTQNLKFLREHLAYPSETAVSDDLNAVVLCQLNMAFEEMGNATVRQVLEQVATDIQLPLHQIQSLFQLFAYKHLITFDWTTVIDLNRPLPQVAEVEAYVG